MWWATWCAVWRSVARRGRSTLSDGPDVCKSEIPRVYSIDGNQRSIHPLQVACLRNPWRLILPVLKHSFHSANFRRGFKLSTNLAMAETTILSIAIKSNKCLDTWDRNEKLRLTAGSWRLFDSDRIHIWHTFPTPMLRAWANSEVTDVIAISIPDNVKPWLHPSL